MVAYPTAQPTDSQFVDSRPISQPSFQSTTGIAAKGFGDVLDQGVESLDKLVKEHLSDNIKAQAYAARDQFTSDLESTDYALRNNTQVAAAQKAAAAPGVTTDASGNPSLLPPKEALPSDLKALPSQIERLGDAKANGNVNKGLLDAQMATLAKDYRSRWPGYTDWIDKQFSEVLGGDPANQRITTLISSINSFVAGQKEKADKTVNMLDEEIKKGNLQASQWYTAYKSGAMSESRVRELVASSNNAEWQYKQNKAIADNVNLDDETRAKFAEKGLLSFGNSEVAKDFNTLYETSGINSSTIGDITEKARRGDIQLDDKQALQLSFQVQANRETRRAFLQSESDKILPNTGRSTTDILGGPKKRDDLINQILSPYDLQIKALAGKDLDLGHKAKELTDAIGHDTLFTMMKDPNWGPLATIMAAGSKAGGPEGAVFMSNILTAKGLKQPDATSLTAIFNRIIAAPDVVHGQPPMPLQQYIQKVQDDPVPIKKKGVIDSILSLVPIIGKKEVPNEAKENVANATFTPNNNGMLGKIQMDFTTPDRVPVRGRYSVFNDYGSEGMIAGIKQIAATNPEVAKRYKDWMETSFGVDLFGQDIASLANSVSRSSDIKILWNNTSNRFEAEQRYHRGESGDLGYFADVREKQLKQDLQTIERINGGIQTMARVSKAFGETDTNAYILKQLQGAGFDTSKAELKDLLPTQMAIAIKASRKKPEESK